MYFTRIPTVIQRFFPSIRWRIKHTNKVYLTFDDGPNDTSTETILRFLSSRSLKASFFCTGRQIEKFPQKFDLIRAYDYGIGNHGYAHTSALKLSDNAWRADIKKGYALSKSDYYRPPYGHFKINKKDILQSNMIMWSLMPGDFDKNLSNHAFEKKIKNNLRAGDIVVLHDIPSALAKVEIYLDYVEKSGIETGDLIKDLKSIKSY